MIEIKPRPAPRRDSKVPSIRHTKAKALRCPRCEAVPGAVCRSELAVPVRPHVERIKAWEVARA